jgi:hypothetical protein
VVLRRNSIKRNRAANQQMALHVAYQHIYMVDIVAENRNGWLGRQDSNLGSRDQNPMP